MKIAKSKKTKKNLFVALGIILVVGVLCTIAAYSLKVGPFSSKSDNGINFDKPSKDELEAGVETKQQIVELDAAKDHSGSDPTPEPQPIENSNKKAVQAEISAVNQDESALHVRTLIQAVTNDGTCSLTMTGPQGKTYTSTASIHPLPSSSTCKGFDIPLDDLSSGLWVIEINFNNDELVASTSKEVSIK